MVACFNFLMHCGYFRVVCYVRVMSLTQGGLLIDENDHKEIETHLVYFKISQVHNTTQTYRPGLHSIFSKCNFGHMHPFSEL